MSYTLLDYVQIILSSMDGDEVNSYDDTVESKQVAEVVRTCYNDLVTVADLPEHSTLFSLQASGDTSLPCVMYVPSDVKTIAWIKYDCSVSGDPKLFQDVTFLALDDFLRIMYGLKNTATGIASTTFTMPNANVINLNYWTNKGPKWYTTLDDHTLLFDAYNSDEDATLQTSKTLCYGAMVQSFTLSNTFVPFLDQSRSSLLLNDAKAQAFIEMKQQNNSSAEKKARRQSIHLQKIRHSVPNPNGGVQTLPNYSRR